MIPEPDLPRWAIAIEAWRVLIENTGAALRNALLPFLILLAMHRVADVVAPTGIAAIAWHLLFVALFPIPMALLLVPWYRTILSAQWPELADRPARWWYVAFMIRTLGLELMWFAFQIPSVAAGMMAVEGGGAPDPQLASLAFILFAAALAPSFYVYGRIGLALPSAAAGDDDSYGRAWRVTAGAGGRIAAISFVVWFPFFMIPAILAGAPAEGAPPPPPVFIDAVVAALIDVFRELTMAAVLALVYAHYGRTPVEDVFS